jgi:large subunit ribosomal protein L22
MGKLATPAKFKPNQAGATAKFLRVPPRKARLVIDAVRGKYVADALAILKFVPNFAAEAISDVIKSAVANAENSRPNDEASGRPLPPLITENLKVVRAFVDEGPRIKRLQPRAQGRAYRILKRMCHITVVVEEVAAKPRPTRPQRASRRSQQAAAARPATVTEPAAKATTKKAATAPAEPEVTAAPVEGTAAVEQTVPAEATAPADTAAPEEETDSAETTSPVLADAPAPVEDASVSADDAKDEIGAPMTTEADVVATNEKNEVEPSATADAPAEEPKTE